MNTVPRPQAAVIDFPSRPHVMEDTQPARQQPWHMAPNRMADPAFLSLSPIAMAALRNLEELCHGGPVIGNKSRVSSMIGLEPKHFHMAIPALEVAGFITVLEQNGVLTIDVIGLPKRRSTGRQQVPNSTSTVRQQVPNRKNKSAIDAGSGGRSLKKNLPNGREEDLEIEKYPPNPPAEKPAPKKRSVSPDFDAFWMAYPKRSEKPQAVIEWQAIDPDADTVAAIMAGLEKAKASRQWTDEGGKWICAAHRFLRDNRWLNDWPPASKLVATDDDIAETVASLAAYGMY